MSSSFEKDDAARWTLGCLAAGISQRSALPHHTVWLERLAQHLNLESDALPPVLADQDLIILADTLPRHENHNDSDFLVHLLHLALGILPLPSDAPQKQPKKSLSQPAYSSVDRSRILNLISCIGIPHPDNVLRMIESDVATHLYTLYTQRDNVQQPGDSSMADNVRSAVQARAGTRSKFTRWATLGAGFLAGGLVIGLTGGLAAPVLAPLLATASGGALAFLASSGGIALLGTLFGLAGGGLGAYRVDRRFKDISEFEYVPVSRTQVQHSTESNPPSLTVTIVISGLLHNKDDYIDAWSLILSRPSVSSSDLFALKWETNDMHDLGKSFNTFARNLIAKNGAVTIIQRTALAAFYTAVALPSAIYSVASYSLDNIFQRSISKARQAGILLADTLEKEIQGPRPVTLIGTSMGALVIYTCLLELEKRHGGKKIFVHNAVLISLPVAPTSSEWQQACSACSEKLVNAYSKNDWLLAIIARIHALGRNVGGLVPASMDRKDEEPVEGSRNGGSDNNENNHNVNSSEPADRRRTKRMIQKRPMLINVDVSEALNGHSDLVNAEVLKNVWEIIETDLEWQAGEV